MSNYVFKTVAGMEPLVNYLLTLSFNVFYVFFCCCCCFKETGEKLKLLICLIYGKIVFFLYSLVMLMKKLFIVFKIS